MNQQHELIGRVMWTKKYHPAGENPVEIIEVFPHPTKPQHTGCHVKHLRDHPCGWKKGMISYYLLSQLRDEWS